MPKRKSDALQLASENADLNVDVTDVWFERNLGIRALQEGWINNVNFEDRMRQCREEIQDILDRVTMRNRITPETMPYLEALVRMGGHPRFLNAYRKNAVMDLNPFKEWPYPRMFPVPRKDLEVPHMDVMKRLIKAACGHTEVSQLDQFFLSLTVEEKVRTKEKKTFQSGKTRTITRTETVVKLRDDAAGWLGLLIENKAPVLTRLSAESPIPKTCEMIVMLLHEQPQSFWAEHCAHMSSGNDGPLMNYIYFTLLHRMKEPFLHITQDLPKARVVNVLREYLPRLMFSQICASYSLGFSFENGFHWSSGTPAPNSLLKETKHRLARTMMRKLFLLVYGRKEPFIAARIKSDKNTQLPQKLVEYSIPGTPFKGLVPRLPFWKKMMAKKLEKQSQRLEGPIGKRINVGTLERPEWKVEHHPGHILYNITDRRCPLLANMHWETLRRHFAMFGTGASPPPWLQGQEKAQWQPKGWWWHFLECVQQRKEERRMEVIHLAIREGAGAISNVMSMNPDDDDDDMMMREAERKLAKKRAEKIGERLKRDEKEVSFVPDNDHGGAGSGCESEVDFEN